MKEKKNMLTWLPFFLLPKLVYDFVDLSTLGKECKTFQYKSYPVPLNVLQARSRFHLIACSVHFFI